jgi:8-oxo-dGTP pyrophosphatase MutT (NUDIX family)
MANEAKPAIPSSTVLLLRDDRGQLEVFMVQRHHQIDFASSALVFPGGKVDPADRDPALRARCTGCEGLDDETFAVRVAAVRETFEECGVLLARKRPQGARSEAKPSGVVGPDAGLLSESEVRPLETRYRSDLLSGAITLGAIAEAHDLDLALDAMVPFAHWITPAFMPKRFDTHFYLVPAPPDQVAAHDGEESVDSLWIAPTQAVADAQSKRRPIIFPTLRNLIKLARSASVAEAIERARREPIVTVLPTVGKGAHGPVIRIPVEAGYDISEASLDEVQ